MKLTCYLCVIFLIASGICGGVYAFTGFNLLKFLLFGSETYYRSFLAVNAVAALFTLYALFAFRPFKKLK